MELQSLNYQKENTEDFCEELHNHLLTINKKEYEDDFLLGCCTV